ncbi:MULTISPECIES: hypothetical protein [Paenibacillus]|nr:hypothetical protein [Paenibacillus caseinilyticus]MCZ8520364.1 hypothetical protein [Paenibacillus caseinilyticus]
MNRSGSREVGLATNQSFPETFCRHIGAIAHPGTALAMSTDTAVWYVGG